MCVIVPSEMHSVHAREMEQRVTAEEEEKGGAERGGRHRPGSRMWHAKGDRRRPQERSWGGRRRRRRRGAATAGRATRRKARDRRRCGEGRAAGETGRGEAKAAALEEEPPPALTGGPARRQRSADTRVITESTRRFKGADSSGGGADGLSRNRNKVGRPQGGQVHSFPYKALPSTLQGPRTSPWRSYTDREKGEIERAILRDARFC